MNYAIPIAIISLLLAIALFDAWTTRNHNDPEQ